MKRVCKYCRKSFRAKQRNQSFCCPTHQKRFHNKGRGKYVPTTSGCQKGDYTYSRINAKIALAKISGQDKEGHNECRYYWCEEHSGYHLTSKK